MPPPVATESADGVTTIVMDDGKANALTFEMFAGINDSLDRCEADGDVALIAGRPGRFSGGFDLGVLTAFTEDSARLLRTGFELSHRLLSFPRPVVMAVTGHAYAMGGFLVLSGDYRLGVSGAEHRITANEVSIGMALPHAAIEVCRPLPFVALPKPRVTNLVSRGLAGLFGTARGGKVAAEERIS